MSKITSFAINNSRVTILFLIFICFFGIEKFVTMPTQEDPEIVIRAAQVTASFPGLSIKFTEELIAKPIERKMKEIPEIQNIRTTVQPGFVIVEPEVYAKYFDLEPIWQNLRNKMDDLKSDLPDGTNGPFVDDDFGDVSAATLALHGKGFTQAELHEFARDIKDNLGSIDIISKVDLFGIQEERIYIEINLDRLSTLGIGPSFIIETLQAQNIILPGGAINADGTKINIDPSGNFKDIEEIRNLQITVPDSDQVIYLRDISTIRRGYIEPPQNPVYYNGEEAIIIAVQMVKQNNIMEFGDILKHATEEISATLPLGLHLDYITYQPDYVSLSLDGATTSLYQTIAVVLTVVMLFLGLRTGLIIGSIVPLTILLTIVVMNMFGIELHRMSIAAIIIALGLLVDNGIVIAEDMNTRIAAGIDKKQAAFQSTNALGIPLLTSSLTTILAFMPLLLAQDTVGEFVRALGQVIVISLLGSWFLAMFATPSICYWLLPKPKAQNDDAYNTRTYRYYSRFITTILHYRVLFLIIMIGLFVLSLYGMTQVKQRLMPPSARNQFLVYMDLPAGSHIQETIASTKKISNWLNDRDENPSVIGQVAYVGFGGPRFFLALNPPDPAENSMFMVVNTKHAADVLPMIEKTNHFFLNEMPEATGNAKQLSLSQDELGTIEYRISGPDENKLWEIAETYTLAMKNIKGSVGHKNDWQNPIVRLDINIDQFRARRANVTSDSIARTLGSYFDGLELSDFREGDLSIPILMRGEEGRDNMDRLRNISVLSSEGTPVPINQVATFDGHIEPSRIMRYNQEKTMTIEGRHPDLTALDYDKKIKENLGDFQIPPGYQEEIGGEIEGSKSANKALFEYMPLAFAMIVILLIWQFNSIRRPLIIFLTIPLSIIGAALGLLLTGAFLDFNGILGLLSLAGIIINNGIVLIDRIDEEIEKSKDHVHAIVTACKARLRPIIMTTLTTILGLMPLIFSGDELWFAMAIVIASGLAVGTILTLGFVPVLYTFFFKVKTKA